MADPRTVTLPLVWRGDMLWIGPFPRSGWVGEVKKTGKWYGIASSAVIDQVGDLGDFPTRPAAMRAVEEAVMRALGAEGGGDG